MIYRNKVGLVEFTLKKEIDYISEKEAIKKEKDYARLNTQTFIRNNIPHFTYERNSSSITYISDFIKGNQICDHNCSKYYDIILEDLIYSDPEYGFCSFANQNFIVEQNTGKIYYIDLDDYRKITVEDRLRRFERDFVKSDMC